MIKRILPFAIVAVVLLVMVAAGVAENDESNPPGAGTAQVDAVEPAAEEAVSVLGRTRTAADAIRDDLARKIDLHADFGMNPALARLAIGNTTSSAYVIPARGHVCAALTLNEGADFSCPATEDLADGKASPTTMGMGDRGIAIYGLVPDGVASVSVQTGRTDTTKIDVENNVYYTVAPAGTPLRTVAYSGPSGRVEFPIVDPSAAFED